MKPIKPTFPLATRVLEQFQVGGRKRAWIFRVPIHATKRFKGSCCRGESMAGTVGWGHGFQNASVVFGTKWKKSESKRPYFFSKFFSDVATMRTLSLGETRFLGRTLKRKIKEQNHRKQNNLRGLKIVLILGFVLYLNCCWLYFYFLAASFLGKDTAFHTVILKMIFK